MASHRAEIVEIMEHVFEQVRQSIDANVTLIGVETAAKTLALDIALESTHTVAILTLAQTS